MDVDLYLIISQMNAALYLVDPPSLMTMEDCSSSWRRGWTGSPPSDSTKTHTHTHTHRVYTGPVGLLAVVCVGAKLFHFLSWMWRCPPALTLTICPSSLLLLGFCWVFFLNIYILLDIFFAVWAQGSRPGANGSSGLNELRRWGRRVADSRENIWQSWSISAQDV